MKIRTKLIICINASILGLIISSPIQAESLFESFGLGLPAINVSDSADGETTYSLSLQEKMLLVQIY